MELLTGIDVSTIGATGLLGVVAVMIYFGLLVPRPFHRQALSDRDARIREKDARLLEQDKLIGTQAKQIAFLLEGGKTTLHIAEAIPLQQELES